VISDLFSGQHSNPVRIVALNTAQGWSRDVTVEIADELRPRCAEQDEISNSVLALLYANQR
jgi:hypothetical protein